jgi:hypothetical protein
MNKICILILAHTLPHQLHRLINALTYEHFDIYVHIDKKSDVQDFQNNNAHFIEDRVSISWGSFAMVQATLNLINCARQKQKYRYFCLLSGTDYPIKSNEFIYTSLLGKETSYIENFTNDDPKWHFRYKKYFIYQNAFLNQLLNYRIRKLLPDRVLPLGYTPYWGSSWWALSDDAIDYVLSVCRNNPKFVDFFKYTSSPDEMFFQTILGNSDFINHMEKPIHYVDWSKGGHHPKLLKFNEDFNQLASSDALFARKFDGTDPDILDEIDSQLRIKKHLS